MRVISLTNATSVPGPDGKPIPAGADGVFDLPHDFALHLTTKHASHWRAESEHEAAIAEAKLDELRNPNVVPGVLAKLVERADKVEARLDALEAAAAKPARAHKAATSKDASGSE